MLETLRKIGDYFPYCFTIVDIANEKDRPCIYTNKSFTINTGYDPDEAIGRNLSYLQGKLTSPETILFMRESFKNRKACIQDIVNYKKDGTPFLNRLLMLPFYTNDQIFYIGIQNDITLKKGLKHDNESLRNVESGEILHTVNNPLTVILGVLSKELKKSQGPEELKASAKVLSGHFLRINDYALNIEKISKFENFNLC